MLILTSNPQKQMRLSEEFLAPYYYASDPFKSLLARSTYLTKYSRNSEVWTDTIRRVVEGNTSLASNVHLDEMEKLFHYFWTGQALPPGRGLWTGGVEGIPSDARYNCFRGTTRFFADGKLATLQDLAGQTVKVRCVDGDWRSAEVRCFGKQKLFKYVLRAPGRSKFELIYEATENHRWLTDNRGMIEDLRVGDIIRVTPDTFDDQAKGLVEYKNGFAHGLVFGDGSSDGDGFYRLRLCGSKSAYLDSLKESPYFRTASYPPSYNGEPSIRLHSQRVLKAVPEEGLSFVYQAGFLAGWLASDGSLRASGRGGNRLSSINHDALNWVTERAPFLGYCVSGDTLDSSTETNYGVRNGQVRVLTLTSESVIYTVCQKVDEGLEEEVYCVTEPETHTFTIEGGVRTGQCWYTTLYGVDDWCWTANQLMLGGGVGVGLAEIGNLPVVSQNPARLAVWCVEGHVNLGEVNPDTKSYLNGQTPVLRVPDSREGWVEALRQVLTSAFEGRDLIVDVSDIRARGLPIRTFGGIACGPGPLVSLLRNSWDIIRNAVGRRLSSVEALDITNYVGLCIKAGNVRRSALIVLGDAQDQAFRDAKKDFDKVRSHRHTSNNSIVFRSWEQIAKFDWENLVEDNLEFGEPGLLNLPLVWASDPGAKGVNPCFSGETLIAVADGRNAVTIRQLADEGKDVPVYSMDKATGKIEIKTARHPRVTGYDKQLVRVWLDDGSYLDTTPNHGFILRDGTPVKAEDLKTGDSLPRFSKKLEKVVPKGKDYYRVYCNTRDSNKDKLFEHRLIAKFHYPEEWGSLYNECKKNGFVKTGGLVIHHKDYDQLNNSPDNLQIMTFKDHAEYHAAHDTVGPKNGRWLGVTPEQVKEAALELTRSLGCRFSAKEWVSFALDRGLPSQFSSYRVRSSGSVLDLAKLCAVELGYEHGDEDPRVLQTYRSMLEQGYDAKIQDGKVLVVRTCEGCKSAFEVVHAFRERSFCSEVCGNAYINSDSTIKEKRVAGLHSIYAQQMPQVKAEQARVLSALKFELKRDPNRKEWSVACKEDGVTSRIGPTLKFGYRSFQEVLEAGSDYNHKVVKVEPLPGTHIVYNITVDDHHTVAVVTAVNENNGNPWYVGVITAQCGEQALHDREACNLAEVFPAQFESHTNPTEVLRLVTRYCLRQRLTPLTDAKSQEVGNRNMRVGVGLGGLCDFDWTRNSLRHFYGTCRDEANRYASELGVAAPITVTTVKPSGTISLLNGSSPGIHAPYAAHYIRRTRIAKNDPLASAMIEAKVPHEEDVYDKTGHTWVFSFPTKAAHTKFTVQTETIRDQFERQKAVQEAWADNAVSATLSFEESEKHELAACLKEYVPFLKSTSVLNKVHGYVQPPYEVISEEQYGLMYSHINHSHPLVRGGEMEVEECAGGVCPIR